MRRRIAAAAVAAALAPAAPVAAATAPEGDPYAGRQWNLRAVGLPEAWQRATGKGVLIAVLDSGVDPAHPDLAGRLEWRIDADLADPGSADGPADPRGHGTAVAGIAAAATGNGIGIAGGAPGARVLPVRVRSVPDEVAAGIRYAAAHGATVVNMSLVLASGDPARWPDLTAVRAAIDKARARGVVLVAAAGNEGAGRCDPPAALPGVLCVGAVDRRGELAAYSNRPGAGQLFLVAPSGARLGLAPAGTRLCAQGVVTTVPMPSAGASCGPEPGYGTVVGTSMAAPLVSAAAALLVERGLRGDAVVQRLLATAHDLGPRGADARFGAGRLDAARALRGLPGAPAPATGGRDGAAPLRLLVSRLGCADAARRPGPHAAPRRRGRAAGGHGGDVPDRPARHG